MFHYYVTKLINTKIMLTSDLVNKQDPITRDTKGFKNNLVDPFVLVLLYLQTYIIGTYLFFYHSYGNVTLWLI